MAEIRKSVPELTEELDNVNAKISDMITEVEKRGISEDITEEAAEELAERKKEIEEEIAEVEKREAIKETLETRGTVIEKVDTEVKRSMGVETREYKNAFGEYLKSNGNMEKISAEARAVLTENATDGMIAVPEGVQNVINTAWENDKIMQRITKTYFKGNLKVGYEESADAAVIHLEGGDAVTPEDLVINYVELVPQMIKKVVEVSDEVLSVNDAMVDYLYDEIQYQIVKLAAETVVSAIATSALTQSSTMAGATPTTADLVTAEGLLGGEATDPVIITTRSNAAAIKAAALGANYGFDPFDGMPVLYTDATALGGAEFIIADLSGVQANFPDGDDAKFKFDDFTKADADIVRIIGRLYAGIGVVAAGKTVKGVAEASA